MGQQALKSVNELDVALKQVVESHQKMAERAVAAARGLDIIGGSSKVTRTELDQIANTVNRGLDAFRAMGVQAPADLQKVADAIKNQQNSLAGATKSTDLLGTASNFLFGPGGIMIAAGTALSVAARQAITYADTLTKMSDRTGIGIEALQRLQAIAEPSGNTIDDLANAVNQFQKRLSEGTATKALDKLGLSLTQINALSPDQQFIAIAKAIQQVQNPAQQAALAMELFGRSGAELLPSLKANVDSLADSTVRMADRSAKALDQLGDDFNAWKRSSIAAVGNVLASLIDFGRQARVEVDAFSHTVLGQMLAGTTIPVRPPTTGVGMNIPLPKTADITQGLGVPGLPADIDKVTDALTRSAKASIEANKKAEDYAHRLADVNDKIREAQRDTGNLTGAQIAQIDSLSKLGLSTSDIATKLKVFDGAVRFAEQSLKDTRTAVKDLEDGAFGLTKVQGIGRILPPEISESWIKLSESIHQIEFGDFGAPDIGKIGGLKINVKEESDRIAKSFKVSIAGAFADLPQLLEQAFTGGGGIGGALGALGTKIGAGLFGKEGPLAGATKAATGALTGVFGKTIGGALSAAIPGIGALIGPGLEAVFSGFKKLFGGPSSAELGARQAAGDFQKQFGSFEQMAAAVSKAFQETGRSSEEARSAIQHFLDATHKDAGAVAAEIQKINDVFNQQKQDAADLDAAIQKYGFSIDELGPKLQKQKLDEQARALTRDFTLLVGAGIDVSTVTDKMGTALNDYVHLAEKTGIEVPAAMKPILEQMIEQGKLTDENGNAITDLGQAGLTFSETMAQGFDRLIAKLDEIFGTTRKGIDDIANAGRAATDVINKIPSIRHLQIVNDFPNAGNVDFGLATGGLITAHGIQHFAAGGRVLPFVRRGSDSVPALLTPGEMVLNASQQAALGGALGGAAAIGARLERLERELPGLIQRVVRDGVQKVARR